MTVPASDIPLFQRISDYVYHYAHHCPDRDALVHDDTRLSWAQLAQQVDACARALLAAGLTKGDRVCVLSTPRPEFWITFLATARIGAVWTGLNPRYTRREMAHVLRDCTPGIILSLRSHGPRDFSDDIDALVGELNIPRRVWFADDPRDFDAFLAEGQSLPAQVYNDAAAAVGASDPCLIVYTSGSTGAPKGAVIPHWGPSYCSHFQNRGWGAKRAPTRLINFFPINHLACVVDISCLALVAGGTLVFMEQFDPHAALVTIEREQITVLGGVPTMLQFIFAQPEAATRDLSSLEVIAVGGAAAPQALIQDMQTRAPLVTTGYGMTETVGQMTFSPPEATAEQISGSIGQPVAEYDLRIADADGGPVPRGTRGEIQVRGAFLFKEYLNQPDATAQSFTPDGWFRTGDVALVRPDGFWKMVGRLSEMYKSGGYNVYPREIEICLESHPDVELAAVIGMPDPTYQEVGHAFCQVRAGVTLGSEDLAAHCRKQLANYKIPKSFTVLAEMPVVPVGKIDKMALADKARGE